MISCSPSASISTRLAQLAKHPGALDRLRDYLLALTPAERDYKGLRASFDDVIAVIDAFRARDAVSALPTVFQDWFADRGWQSHDHQLAMLAAARAGQSALLTAPTGGGKTLAGFLPSLVELAEQPDFEGLHTIYISPLKALATDIRRNLETPLSEMALPITAEARTGDTPPNRRARQRENPPNILMTTPESLALLLSLEDSDRLFANAALCDS